MRRPLVRATALLLLTLPVATGCASYVATPLRDLPVGQPVRVSLTRQAYEALPRISDLPGTRYQGTLVRRSDAELVVHVPLAVGSPLGQDVVIPTEGITEAAIRKPSPARTTLVVAAGVAVVVGVVLSASHSGPLQDGPGGNPDTGEDPFTGRMGRSISFSFPLW